MKAWRIEGGRIYFKNAYIARVMTEMPSDERHAIAERIVETMNCESPFRHAGWEPPSAESHYDPLCDHAVLNRLRDAGWTPPPEPPKPKVHFRVRLILPEDDRIFIADGRVERHLTDKGSAIVDLTEGVFDEEWSR